MLAAVELGCDRRRAPSLAVVGIKAELLAIGVVDHCDDTDFAHLTSDLADPERRFTLSPDDLALINPTTRTAPVFRTRRDAEITKAIYRRVPVLVRDGDRNGSP